jgi:hypothetical protein
MIVKGSRFFIKRPPRPEVDQLLPFGSSQLRAPHDAPTCPLVVAATLVGSLFRHRAPRRTTRSDQFRRVMRLMSAYGPGISYPRLYAADERQRRARALISTPASVAWPSRSGCHHYNWHCPHTSVGGRAPMTRVLTGDNLVPGVYPRI